MEFDIKECHRWNQYYNIPRKKRAPLDLLQLTALPQVTQAEKETVLFTFEYELFTSLWEEVKQKVHVLFGPVEDWDFETKLTYLSWYNFKGTFPFRVRSQAAIDFRIRLQDRSIKIIQKKKASGLKPKVIRICFLEEVIVPNCLPRIIYPIMIEDLFKVHCPSKDGGPKDIHTVISPNILENVEILIRNRNPNYHNNKFVEFSQVRVTWPELVLTKQQTRETISEAPQLVKKNTIPFPKDPGEFEQHFDRVLRENESINFREPEAFTQLTSFWKSLYLDPPEVLVDQIIDRIYKLYEGFPKSMRISQEADREYAIKQNIPNVVRLTQEFCDAADTIPNTLGINVDENLAEIREIFKSKKYQGLCRFHEVARYLHSILLNKIRDNYPQGLIPEKGKRIPDYDRFRIDMSSADWEVFGGQWLRPALKKMVTGSMSFQMQKYYFRYFNKFGTFAYRNQWFYHEDQSGFRTHQLMSFYLSKLKDWTLCPQTGKKLGVMDLRCLTKYSKKLYFDYIYKVWLKHDLHVDIQFDDVVIDKDRGYQQFCEVESNLDFGEHEETVFALVDDRSELSGKDLRVLLNQNLFNMGQFYLTPNFLQHFDMVGIGDPYVLRKKVKYAASQMGIYLLTNQIGNKNSLRSWWDPDEGFICPVGNRSHLREMNQMLKLRAFLDEERETKNDFFEEWKDLQPCSFRLYYRRCEPNDVHAPYILVKYNMTHSHPLASSLVREWMETTGELKKQAKGEI